MSQSEQSLDAKIDEIESKAEEYKKSENYEATKQDYLNRLSTIESSLTSLKQRSENLDFFESVLTEIIAQENHQAVEDAKRSSVKVTNRDVDDFWEMVDEGKTDQYKKKIQQTRSEIKKAQDDVEEDIREFESDWLNTLSSAKEVQKLVGESKERNRAMNEIEYFVTDEIWDNSKDINQLINTWESLEQTWREVRVDWEQFQKENSLNDQTIGLLKDLADGDEVSFSRMTDDVAEEILSVSELKNVLKVTI